MDEGETFMKLWFTPPSTDFVPYVQEEETFLNESYVFRSFRSEFEVDKCFTKSCLKAVKNAEDKNIYSSSTRFEDFIPGYSPLSYLPKKSVFSRQEMNECYEIVLLLSNFKTLTLEQQEKLNYYKERMSAEQKEYLALAKSHWMRENYTRHKEIIPEVEKFINKLWQAKLDRVRTYPKFYSQSCLISLCPIGDDPIEFIFCSQLKKLGKLSRLFLPNLRFIRMNINNCVENVSNYRLEGKARMVNNLSQIHGYYPEISKDKVAEEVALFNNAHVVMSASSFLALVDNHMPDFLATWDLPITVKEYSSDFGIKNKIVYIDKKFPPRSMNQNERKNWYCKIACENRVKRKSGIKRCSKAIDADNPEEDARPLEGPVETSSDLYNTRDEEFTSSDPECDNGVFHTRTNTMAFNNISDTDSDVHSLTIDESFVDNDENKGVTDCNEVHTSDYPVPASNSGTCKSNADVNKDKAKKLNTNKINESISYCLWRLHKAASSYLSKNVSRDLAILIRCKEGYLGIKKTDDVKTKRELYKVVSKMEYQPEFGAEQVSLSELTRQWASLLIRPGTHLARLRVNPLDGEVIMYDKMNLSNLAAEGQRLYGVNLNRCLGPFHSVVEKLTDLPAGQYYLSHRPVNSAFAPLYKATTGAYELSLNTSFNINSNETAPERASWNPLDVNIVNPTFKHFHRVPAMFTPSKVFNRNVENATTMVLRSTRKQMANAVHNKKKNTNRKGKKKKLKQKKKQMSQVIKPPDAMSASNKQPATSVNKCSRNTGSTSGRLAKERK